jgi:hypothetical protein
MGQRPIATASALRASIVAGGPCGGTLYGPEQIRFPHVNPLGRVTVMSLDVGWKQRFANFDRALALLAEASTEIAGLSMLEKEGVIQRFEYTLELGWKTIKDYLDG